MNILSRWLRSYLPELPVSDQQLAEDLTLRGIAVEGIFPAEGGGSLFEMDLTTNRVDAMNHYGVAREAAAIYDLPLTALETAAGAPGSESPDSGHPEGGGYPVRIEARDLCGRFTARVVRGVTVGAARGLLSEYFAALGQKPISGPVDATNFGWLAMGQPTHVFDLDTLEGGLVVRRAFTGERLRLLDGTERTLTAEDLVVADEQKALGLAGVMGGWDSRVTQATKNILVEAAWFDPAAIRASSRRHGLHTDASHRFERGADFEAAPVANHLVTRLVVEQSGGEAVGPLVDVVVPEVERRTAKRPPVPLRFREVERHLGTTAAAYPLTSAVVERYLRALGCGVAAAGEGEYGVLLPSWRLDLEREIDLIEEIARMHGYNRFAGTLPGWAGVVAEPAEAAQACAIRGTLRALGFSEAVSSTFVSAAEAETFGEEAAGAVAMGNPLSEEAGMLRPALVAGMAGMLARNLHRDAREVRLFELGTVFTGSPAEVRERTGLALGLAGESTGGSAGGKKAVALYRAEDAAFFTMKGALERLLGAFAGAVSFDQAALPAWLEPGRGARALLDGEPVAVFGELSAAEAQRRKLRQTCVLAEVRAEVLLGRPLRAPATRELSRFQAVERDFSFVFPESVVWRAVEAALGGLAIAELTRIEPVEIFRDAQGKAVAGGSYSLLLRVTLQSGERTLTEEEIAAAGEKAVAALTALGGVQRA